jgi:hypothetical protein
VQHLIESHRHERNNQPSRQRADRR